MQALAEISVEDRKMQLDHSQTDIVRVEARLVEVVELFRKADKEHAEAVKKEKAAKVCCGTFLIGMFYQGCHPFLKTWKCSCKKKFVLEF